MNVFRLLALFVSRLYSSAVNKRNLLTLPINFCVNFSPVFIWLFIFKNAGVIPAGIRPNIHNKLAFLSDLYMFGDYWHELVKQYGEGARVASVVSFFTSSLFAVVFLICIPLCIWYYIYYKKKVSYNVIDWYDHIFHRRSDGVASHFRPTKPRVILPFLFPFFTYVMLNVDHLFASQDESNFTKSKDLLAWFSYVLLHLLAPIFTAVYLYVFQPPGTLKCFAFALGLQNIAGVFSHLLIPMAPPWFIHMYGVKDTEHLNYETEGYAAGLTRVDSHLGTHLNSKGFHKSPIVFGAVPSLHSAIAIQCFLFLITRATTTKANGLTVTPQQQQQQQLRQPTPDDSSTPMDEGCPSDGKDIDVESFELEDMLLTTSNGISDSFISSTAPQSVLSKKWLFVFNKALLPRGLVTAFIILQWWSTMYLDHHFRYDLFVGMCYAITSFLIINTFVLQPRVLKPWCDIRMGKVHDERNEGRTLGMRVFQNTKMEWFFDPLA